MVSLSHSNSLRRGKLRGPWGRGCRVAAPLFSRRIHSTWVLIGRSTPTPVSHEEAQRRPPLPPFPPFPERAPPTIPHMRNAGFFRAPTLLVERQLVGVVRSCWVILLQKSGGILCSGYRIVFFPTTIFLRKEHMLMSCPLASCCVPHAISVSQHHSSLSLGILS